MHQLRKLCLITILIVTFSGCKKPISSPTSTHTVKNPYAEHVRTTQWLSPENEKMAFKLPPGFEITLFASEPNITKPINIEFDDRGRLWVTQSSEYPIEAGNGDGHDRITILEDKDGDGTADSFTNFADDLNIPIGIMPMHDGAVAYSIPNLYYFKDINQDGKADERRILLGPFGHQDTHGMVNNILRGYDGWLNICHGFSNTSTVAGSDGDSITMTSGNTFRIDKNGLHVQQTTFGRVNPFGQAYDENGYLYSVDCHTKPIAQLIFGGNYPHFGKKAPEGIGFAPEMMNYDLSSTALAGLVYYTGNQFPEQYRHSFFTGDVVTCRIDRNTITFNGTSPVAKKEAPFLVSADPWFRPVDIKLGPDGALYIADFYNRIIGHYEVALSHEGRDRRSGRIWKITYTGTEPHEKAQKVDWSKANLEKLLTGLSNPQLDTRFKIANRIVDTFGEEALESVRSLIQNKKDNPQVYIHALWILNRLDALDDTVLDEALQSTASGVRIHAFRILKEKKIITDTYYKSVLAALSDSDPFIRRTAAEILNKFPHEESLRPLIKLYETTETNDTHLRYTSLLAIRENLKDDVVMWHVPNMNWSEQELQVLVQVMLDVPKSTTASFLLDYVMNHDISHEKLIEYLKYVASFAPSYKLESVVDLIRTKFKDNPDEQLDLFNNIQTGIAQSGNESPDNIKIWGASLSNYFLAHISESDDIWKSKPLTRLESYIDPWMVSDQFLTDITPAFRIILSEGRGYKPMSTLYSVPFVLPEKLAMNIFDNDIHNLVTKTGISNNMVRIRLQRDSSIIATYRAEEKEEMPREHLIKNKSFDLSKHKGQMGFIEAIDSSMNGSVGIGKLEPSVLAISKQSPAETNERRVQAIQITEMYNLIALQPKLQDIFKSKWMDASVRTAAASALMSLDTKNNQELVSQVFRDPTEQADFRAKLTGIILRNKSEGVLDMLGQTIIGAARELQLSIVTALAASKEGIARLILAFNNEDLPFEVATENSVKERVDANVTFSQKTQFEKIYESGMALRENRQKIIDSRIAGFVNKGDAVKGREIFQQNCSSCHQIKNDGGLIGPQLDGIGNWGNLALTQKILDPNRNITEAFRTYNITLKNGKQFMGLYLRTAGEVMIFADLTGTEFSINKNDIQTNLPSKYTLMPDNFRNTIPEQEFYDLMRFLINVK